MEKTPLSRNPLSEPFLWIFLFSFASAGMVFAVLFHFSVFLPLLICGGLLALILLFRAPILLLFGLIIVRMSLDYSSQYFGFTLFNITLSLSQLLGVGIALLGIMTLLLKRKALSSFPLNFPFFIIFFWGIATLLYTVYPKNTLQELLRLFDLFALGFLAYVTIQTTRDFKHLLHAFFLSSVLPIVFGFYQVVFHIGLIDENVSILRIFGTFSHPNVYSLYLFSMIVFGGLYLLLFAESGLKRLITLCGLSLLFIMLLLTFARVAWVALFIFAFLIVLFRYRFLLLPLILFPIMLYILSPIIQERITESFRSDPDSSLLWRTTLWQDVIRYSLLEERLLFGSGMDTFPKVSESVRGITHGPNDPHNDFVKFFIEGGLVGLSIFIVYLGSIGYLIIKKYRESKPESALRLAYSIMLLFFLTLELSALTDNIFKNTPVQWLFFTALGSLLALSENRKSK